MNVRLSHQPFTLERRFALRASNRFGTPLHQATIFLLQKLALGTFGSGLGNAFSRYGVILDPSVEWCSSSSSLLGDDSKVPLGEQRSHPHIGIRPDQNDHLLVPFRIAVRARPSDKAPKDGPIRAMSPRTMLVERETYLDR